MARSGQPTDPHPALRATFSQREKGDDKPAILIPDNYPYPFKAFAPGSVKTGFSASTTSASYADISVGSLALKVQPPDSAVSEGLNSKIMSLKRRAGGFRNMPEPSGAARGDWHAMAWVSAGILGNAASEF